MSDAIDRMQFRRELAHRAGQGLDVTLYWHPPTNALTVCVVDERHQDYFEIDTSPSHALAAFYHPFLFTDEPQRFASAA